MTLFQSPVAAVLFIGALLLTLLGACLKKGHILSFFGGLCYAGCVVCIYLADGTTQEILVLAMLPLCVSQLPLRKRGEGRK